MSLPYKTLVVWQRADDLFIDIHRLTQQHFPREEQYELGRQLRRAAYSVPANIVEGFARQHGRDRINFFNIASASLSELTYGLHAAHRLVAGERGPIRDVTQVAVRSNPAHPRWKRR